MLPCKQQFIPSLIRIRAIHSKTGKVFPFNKSTLSRFGTHDLVCSSWTSATSRSRAWVCNFLATSSSTDQAGPVLILTHQLKCLSLFPGVPHLSLTIPRTWSGNSKVSVGENVVGCFGLRCRCDKLLTCVGIPKIAGIGTKHPAVIRKNQMHVFGHNLKLSSCQKPRFHYK